MSLRLSGWLTDGHCASAGVAILTPERLRATGMIVSETCIVAEEAALSRRRSRVYLGGCAAAPGQARGSGARPPSRRAGRPGYQCPAGTLAWAVTDWPAPGPVTAGRTQAPTGSRLTRSSAVDGLSR